MTGFASLFAVEARTMWRTWHRYALPVVLVFLAALSVALSRFAPELFKALAGEGFQIELPEPSPDQSYAQWAKNLTQTGVFLVIFSGAGATSALISSGRAQLLAVRPVSRAAQPVAAFLARALVVGSSCLAGAAVGITPEDDGESISFNLTAAPGDGSAGARIPVDGTMFHDPRDDSSNPGLSDLGSVYGRIALRDVTAISAPGATVLVLATGPGYLGRTSVRLYGVGRGDA